MRLGLALSCALLSCSAFALAAPPSKVSTAMKTTQRPAVATTAASQDPYQWLEDVTGKKALDWVAQHDARSTKALADDEAFKALDARFLAILDSKEKIPYVEKVGDSYYNFWQDRDHPRGLWRRTTLAEYRKDRPAWETVLDVDSLNRAENESWVWEGASALPPDYTRCLISLSRGGADARVTREFDLTTRSFVPDGFVLPEAKSNAAWREIGRAHV